MIDPSLFPNLGDFKIGFSDTLFQPQWEALLQYKCPLCCCKLRFPFKKPIAYCGSHKHKRFVILLKRLEEIKNRQLPKETPVESILPVH